MSFIMDGLIDKPLKLMYASEAVVLDIYILLLPFMVMPLYSSIEKLDKSLSTGSGAGSEGK